MRLLLLLLCFLFTSFTTTQPNQDYTVIENKATTPLLTPSLAAIKTRKIRLNNGLEAYLVSDPNTDKSSAVLNMRTGSWEDPNAYPGIAHFLEHMLFLGTKKYPHESEYTRYIIEHGGETNAFTTNDYTSFIFSINNSAFDEALDRFSSFFKEPLFNPSGVARELHAIDQEFAKNIDADEAREVYVYKELANPKHPYHRFSIGNTSTLSAVSQNTLKDWYHTHYSANLMRLMVVSPLPLDTLTTLVVRDFKDVPTNGRTEMDVNMRTFSHDLDGKIVYIEPIKNLRSLNIVWDLPAAFSNMRDSKPDDIVCYVMGHEGEESLLAELKREKLATELKCGSFQLGPNNQEFFIEIELTDNGVKQVYTVLERVFQALANFRKKGAPSYLFNEVQQLEKMRYQYKPREEAFLTMMLHATQLAHENMDTYPEQTEIMQKFDPQAIQELLDFLTPLNAHYDVMAPAALTQVPPEHKEKWVGIEYAIQPIPKNILDSWTHVDVHPKIDLPAPNPYIPKDLSHVKASSKEQNTQSLIPHPSLIINNERGKIYFATDKKFLTPRIGWIFEFRTPQVDIGDPLKAALADLYIKCITETLNPSTYPATLADLSHEFIRSENGIALEIEGYSDKAGKLLNYILKRMKGWSPTQEQFKVFKETLLREYQNSAFDPPIKQADELMKSALYKNFSTDKQKGAALRKTTFEKFSDYTQQLFSQVYVQGMMYGNMTEEKAKDVAVELLNSLTGDPYPVDEQIKTEVIVLPDTGGPFFVECKTEVQGNALLLAIQYPTFSLKNRAAQQIAMQAISEPFFTELRTKQQTGYIVQSTGEELERELFDFFAVQSNTHDPRDLLARFELFIERYLQEIHSETSEDRFNKIRAALVDNLKTPAKNIKVMAELLHHLAFKYDGDFNWIDERVAAFDALTYDEYLMDAHKFLGRQNKRRLAVMMRGSLPEKNMFQYTRVTGIPALRDLSKFVSKDKQG